MLYFRCCRDPVVAIVAQICEVKIGEATPETDPTHGAAGETEKKERRKNSPGAIVEPQ